MGSRIERAGTALSSPTWWKAAGVRATKTAAQSGLAVLGTDLAGIAQMDLLGAASVMAGAAVVSLLTSLAGLPEVGDTEVVDIAD